MKLSVIGPSVQQVTHRFLHELLLELYGQKGVFALRWSLRLSGFVTNLFACVLIVCSWCSNSFSLTQSSPINNTVILMGKMTSVLRHIPKTIVLVLKEMKCLTTCRAASPPRLWNYIGPLCWNKKKRPIIRCQHPSFTHKTLCFQVTDAVVLITFNKAQLTHVHTKHEDELTATHKETRSHTAAPCVLWWMWIQMLVFSLWAGVSILLCTSQSCRHDCRLSLLSCVQNTQAAAF